VHNSKKTAHSPKTQKNYERLMIFMHCVTIRQIRRINCPFFKWKTSVFSSFSTEEEAVRHTTIVNSTTHVFFIVQMQ